MGVWVVQPVAVSPPITENTAKKEHDMDLRTNRQIISKLQILDTTKPSNISYPSKKINMVFFRFVVGSNIGHLFCFVFWIICLYYLWISGGGILCRFFFSSFICFIYILITFCHICDRLAHFAFNIVLFPFKILILILPHMSIFLIMSFFERSSVLQCYKKMSYFYTLMSSPFCPTF